MCEFDTESLACPVPSPPVPGLSQVAAQNLALLERLEREGQTPAFLEHINRILGVVRKYLTVHYLDRTSDFVEFVNTVNRLKVLSVAELSEQEIDLLCAVALFGMARVRLEQVNLVVNMNSALHYLGVTAREYSEHLELKGEQGVGCTRHLAWWELAPMLPGLRSRIDKHFYRIAQIDGSNWCRAELLLDRSSIDPTNVPNALRVVLNAELPEHDIAPQQPITDFIKKTTHTLIAHEGNPLRLLKAVMRAASEDPVTRSDYSTLLFPRGTKLDEPWTTTHEDFAAHVVFRSGFSPEEGEGIGNFEMIQKAMLAHHAAKKARNASAYLIKYGPNAQPALSDDLGELGVYYNESSHHKGHKICGVRSAMRFLTPIEMQMETGRLRVEGLTDFRLTRISNDEDQRYVIDQFPLFYSYGCWIRSVVEASFEAGYIFPRALHIA